MGKSTLRREKWKGGANSALKARRLICGGSGGSVLTLVGTGTVQTGDGNPQQAVVHGELRAVMDQVIHHHAANARGARHSATFLSNSASSSFRLAIFGSSKAGPPTGA